MKAAWRETSLAELCTIKNGKSDTQDAVAAGEYAFFDRSKVLKRSDRFLFDCEALIVPGEGTEFLPKHFEGKFDLHQRAYALHDFSSEVEARYLYHWLHYRADYLPSVAVGATVKSLRMRHFEQFPVQLPPLRAEQRRIVALLDEAFEGIATAKANTEKNAQGGSELFEAEIDRVFSTHGRGWTDVKLGELGTAQTGSTPKTSNPANYGDHIPFIKPGDFHPDGSLDYDNEGLSLLGMQSARVVPSESVLMVCIGATIGKTAHTDRLITTNQQINALTPRNGILAPFLYYQMLSKDFQRRMRDSSAQATLPIINKSKWCALDLTVPPDTSEQHSICRRLDQLGSETRRLASTCRQKLEALDELKKSLLHRAFTGQL